MKTEIIYEGKISERKLTTLRNLAELCIDGRLQVEIRDAEKSVQDKERFKEWMEGKRLNSHVYFDIMLGTEHYPVVTVGDYGIGVLGNADNPIFKDNQLVYEITKFDDILNFKAPWIGHPVISYEQFVLDNMRDPADHDLIPDELEMDYKVFATSALWKELSMKRDLLAEKQEIEPYLVYRVHDVFELLGLFPEKVISTSPIEQRYQKIILQAWKQWLSKETVCN